MSSWLLEKIRTYDDQEAIVWNGNIASYRELADLAETWTGRLNDAGVEQGSTVALVGDFAPESCAGFLALIEQRCIVVPLMPATYTKHPEFLDIADVDYIIDTRTDITIAPRESGEKHDLVKELIEQKEPGLVLFSSGSTGNSKAAIHNLTPLLEKYRTPRPPMRSLTFLLLDHIGGVNTFFHVISNGGVLVATSERTPAGVFKAVEQARVELLPVSPTFLNLCLLTKEYKNYDISCLNKITYGTEPMPQSTLDALAVEFPNVTLQQTYGLTEVGIMRSKSRDDGSLWVKVGGQGYETKIVDGKLWIKSTSAMLGYLNAPSPFDDEGWFNTHDIVELDGDYIRFKGRDSEIINVGGEKVFPAEVESLLLTLDNIKDVTVHGEKNSLVGQVIVATVNLIQPEPARDLKKRIRRDLKNKTAEFKIPQKIIVAEEEQFNERFKRMRRAS